MMSLALNFFECLLQIVNKDKRIILAVDQYFEYFNGIRRKKYLPTVYSGNCGIRADIEIRNNDIFILIDMETILFCSLFLFFQ